MNATTLRRALLAGVLLACGCSGSDANQVAPAADTDAGAADVASPTPPAPPAPDAAPDAGRRRGFRMGFTPFPFDATAEAQAKVYEHLANDADLYAFHMTAGVPWKAAAEKKPLAQWGSAIRGTFATQKAAVQKGHAVYLGLTPLDDSRTRLADEWADAEHVPLTPPWDGYALDAPEVKAAYLHFCEEAIAHYAPDFLAIGLEVNLLAKNAPAKWDAYVSLHRDTYLAIKAKHPTLPVFASFTAVDILPSWTSGDADQQARALADVMPYSDYLALSFYPYMSRFLTGPIPDDTFEQLSKIAGQKPIAIAESGFPAETFTLASIPATVEGSPDKQDAWIERLLAEADARRFAFVVNFVSHDYDALWEKLPDEQKELGLLWRDTGLFAGDGTERKALGRWRAALARPR